MSTKIYNGFAIPALDAIALMKLLADFRVAAHEVAIKTFIKDVIQRAAVIHDQFTTLPYKVAMDWMQQVVLYTPDHNGYRAGDSILRRLAPGGGGISPILAAMILVREESNADHRANKRGMYDYEMSLSFLPGNDKLLGIPFGLRREYQSLLESLPGYQSYGYWNNTDPDDTVSEEEWDARGEEWNAALGRRAIPSLAGITAEIILNEEIVENYERVLIVEDGKPIKAEHIAEAEAVLSKLTSNDERRADAVRRLVFNALMDDTLSDELDALRGRITAEYEHKQRYSVASQLGAGSAVLVNKDVLGVDAVEAKLSHNLAFIALDLGDEAIQKFGEVSKRMLDESGFIEDLTFDHLMTKLEF